MNRNPSAADRQLERIYSLPNENVSLLDWQRARHLDVPVLDDLDLWREGRRAEARLVFETDRYVADWLMARVGAVAAERRRRRSVPADDGQPDLFRNTQPPRGLRVAEKGPAAGIVLASGAVLTPVRGGGSRGR